MVVVDGRFCICRCRFFCPLTIAAAGFLTAASVDFHQSGRRWQQQTHYEHFEGEGRWSLAGEAIAVTPALPRIYSPVREQQKLLIDQQIEMTSNLARGLLTKKIY